MAPGMKGNTGLYPFWNPGNSGAAKGFANPVGLATEVLAAALMESRILQVPQEVRYNKNYLPMQQYASSATRLPAPQMPAKLPVIPTDGSLLSQAHASLLLSTGAKKQ